MEYRWYLSTHQPTWRNMGFDCFFPLSFFFFPMRSKITRSYVVIVSLWENQMRRVYLISYAHEEVARIERRLSLKISITKTNQETCFWPISPLKHEPLALHGLCRGHIHVDGRDRYLYRTFLWHHHPQEWLNGRLKLRRVKKKSLPILQVKSVDR